MLLREARKDSNLLQPSLRRVMSTTAILREFGSITNAVHAAGLDAYLAKRRHGGARERLIALLRERAARDEHSFTWNLYKLTRHVFGSADAARRAAGVPSPIAVRATRKRKRGPVTYGKC